jgi:hypothetical protein
MDAACRNFTHNFISRHTSNYHFGLQKTKLEFKNIERYVLIIAKMPSFLSRLARFYSLAYCMHDSSRPTLLLRPEVSFDFLNVQYDMRTSFSSRQPNARCAASHVPRFDFTRVGEKTPLTRAKPKPNDIIKHSQRLFR